MSLANERCVDCAPGMPALDGRACAELVSRIPAWSLAEDGRRLVRRLRFPDFRQAMAFVSQVADLAEAEHHHPDIAIHYDAVDLALWTHSAGGLTRNDFVLAAKIDRVVLP
jgi:4a-hydroxytetrahydrobiopterin dehydratase